VTKIKKQVGKMKVKEEKKVDPEGEGGESEKSDEEGKDGENPDGKGTP
jgi:hypothetical protein